MKSTNDAEAVLTSAF